VKKSDFYEELSAKIMTSHLMPSLRAEKANSQPQKEDIGIFDFSTGKKVGIGEVKAQLDPKSEAFSAEVLKRGRTVSILQDADGIWDVRVTSSFNFQNSIEALKSICEFAIATNASLDVRFRTFEIAPETHNAMRKHQVVSVTRIGESSPAKVFLHEVSKGGFIPDQVSGIDDWLKSSSIKYKNSLERLNSSNLSQRHLFIWLSDATPPEIRETARFNPQELPKEDLKGWDFLTHIWLGLSIWQDGTCLAWLFEPKVGWKLVKTNQLAFLESIS